MSDNTVITTSMSVYQSVPTAIFILYPLSIKRDMSAFRYLSMFSIISLAYTGLVLTIELPSYYSHFKGISDMVPYYIDLNLFTGCSMVFFSYTC